MRKTADKNIIEGMAVEREEFVKLLKSEQSAALRHAFAAEKMANKTTIKALPEKVEKIGIIGGGTMGVGISTAFLTSGFSICLIEQDQTAANKAYENIDKNLKANVQSGRMSVDKATQCLATLTTSTDTTLILDDAGTDGYTVSIDADGIGGTITVVSARTSDFTILI